MPTDTQLTTAQPRNVREYLALPAYKDRFTEVLRQRAPQFMAAITQVSQLPALKDAEPRSVLASAMVAATLDLPINPTLGMAFIVAYGDGSGTKVAQFQIGYKGLIQLALRSGQYKRLNAGPLSEGAFQGYDHVGEPVIDFTKNDPLLPPVGYYCAFETLNGFCKSVYWTQAQVEAHARRFSKAYQKGWNSPWKSDFQSMATKTVIKAALTKWGIMSVEMQRAAVHDQGVQADVDADVNYVDADIQPNEGAPDTPPERPAPPPRKPRGARAAMKTAEPMAPEVATEPTTEPEPDQPADEIPGDAPAKRSALDKDEIVEAVFILDSETGPQVHPTKGADGNAKHYVSCVVSNDQFENLSVYDWNGAPDGVLNPLWKAGASVKLRLLGKLQGKIGKVAAMVEGIG